MANDEMTCASSYLFTLASDYGVPFSDGPLEDEHLFAFREAYLKWSQQRDQKVLADVQRNAKLFRVYLPFSDRILRTAIEVVWYFDEVVFRDPIAVELLHVSTDVKSPESRERLERQKDKIRGLVQSLTTVRNAIEQGYFLLVGPSVFSETNRPPSDYVERILASPPVKPAIVDAIRWAYAPMEDPERGSTGHIYGGSLDSSKWFGLSTTIPPGVTTRIPMQFLQRPIPHTELCVKLGFDPLDQSDDAHRLQMEHVFSRAVEWPINSIARAHQFGSAVLFDRRVDEIILQHTANQVDERRQASVGTLNVLLPYVKNIPVERLADLREQMPEALRDFRGRMHEVVKAAADEVDSNEELHQRVEREIVPELRRLESEINAALSRAKVMQHGIPIVSAAATLLGLKLGVDAKWILGGVSAAALKMVAESGSKAETITRAEGHPFYFLWKATKSKQMER